MLTPPYLVLYHAVLVPHLNLHVVDDGPTDVLLVPHHRPSYLALTVWHGLASLTINFTIQNSTLTITITLNFSIWLRKRWVSPQCGKICKFRFDCLVVSLLEYQLQLFYSSLICWVSISLYSWEPQAHVNMGLSHKQLFLAVYSSSSSGYCMRVHSTLSFKPEFGVWQ